MKRQQPKRKQLTEPLNDKFFFDLWKAGLIRVYIKTGITESCRGKYGKTKWRILTQYERNDRMFVACWDFRRKKNRKIHVARLVWMAANNQLIPEGIEIDHDNHNPKHNNHHNLLPKPKSLNRSLNQWCQRFRDARANDKDTMIDLDGDNSEEINSEEVEFEFGVNNESFA